LSEPGDSDRQAPPPQQLGQAHGPAQAGAANSACLVERGGEARAIPMPTVSGKNIRDALVRNADRKSRLHTDESPLYDKAGAEFAKHETVNHSVGEYARGDVTSNTVEGFFAIFKRGMVGVY
jgi:hypothetical protein